MKEDVHRIHYAWSERSLLDERGMGPVESTLPAGVLAEWDPYLRDHVWAAHAHPAFTFLLHRHCGVLIRKVPANAEEGGRPGSAAHVLISEQLTGGRALGLTAWDGWDKPARDVLPWSDYAEAADAGLAEIRTKARKLPTDRLSGLFASLLAEPGAAFTVVGEPDPLALTCAFADLIGRRTTFASDEADDTGSRLPDAVFLPEAPASVTVALRRRLVPMTDADPAVRSFAAAAVDAYRAHGLDGVVHVRPAQAPGDAAAARDWAVEAQFAPGVLADLTRLRTLPPEVLTTLVHPEILERVVRVAGRATARHLAGGVTEDMKELLPFPLAAVIIREAVGRVFADPDDTALLGRLAAIGPLGLPLVEPRATADLDQRVRVGRALLIPPDRRIFLQEAARSMAFGELFAWIDANAHLPEDAACVYPVLCEVAVRADPADGPAVAGRGALVDAVRRFAPDASQASAHLVRLLAALPDGVLTRDVVVELADRSDPALLHALDTVITDQEGRDAILDGVRAAFYRSHRLAVPEDQPEPEPEAESGWWPRRRRSPSPPRHRKPM